MHTGWLKDNGNWYFLNGSGVMQTGWVSSGGKWYLMGSDGAMLKGWQTVGDRTYFFNRQSATGLTSLMTTAQCTPAGLRITVTGIS